MRSSTQSSMHSVGWYAWLVWILGASYFFAEYFGRVGPSVMTDQLMQAYNVGAFALGSMSAFFYYPYIMMQVPVGGLVDRFGPHRLMTVMSLLCGVSCVMFSMTTSLWQAEMCRLLMGFTASFAFVGTLKIATIWFPVSRLGLLAGFTQGLGMLGAAVGQGPFAYIVERIGWRETMLLIGIILLVCSALIGLFVRDGSSAQLAERPQVNVWEGLRLVVRSPLNWIIALYAGLLYAPTAAFAELWGPSFIHQAYSISAETAAFSVSAVFIGWAIGGPLVGLLSDHIQARKPALYLSTIGSLLCISAIIYWPHLSLTMIFLLMFLYGIFNTGVGVAYAVAGEIHPSRFAGSSMAFTNMASVLIGALFQPVIGKLLELNWDGRLSLQHVPLYSPHAFRVALLFLPLCLLLSLGTAFFMPETYGLNEGKK